MRVLSIDGGGIRGILPATILMALEQEAGKPIHELFDLIVGTSTGGILAIALTCPLATGFPATAEVVRSLYVDQGESIFPLGGVPVVSLPTKENWLFGVRTPLPDDATPAERLQHLLGYQNAAKVAAAAAGSGAQGNARYPASGLEAQLHERFGDHRMSEAVVPIGVVSCDFDRGQPIVFWGGGLESPPMGDAMMRVAARATSAAPTFFPPMPYTDSEGHTRSCVDGGLIANDPAFVGFTMAMGAYTAAGQPAQGIRVISLGTGSAESGESLDSHDAEQMSNTQNWAQIAPYLMKAFTGGSGELIRGQLEVALRESYIRIQAVLPAGVSPAMDDARPEHVKQLIRVAEQQVNLEHDRIRALAQSLAVGK